MDAILRKEGSGVWVPGVWVPGVWVPGVCTPVNLLRQFTFPPLPTHPPGLIENGLKVGDFGTISGTTYESNVIYALRFMIDLNVVRVGGGQGGGEGYNVVAAMWGLGRGIHHSLYPWARPGRPSFMAVSAPAPHPPPRAPHPPVLVLHRTAGGRQLD